MCLNSSHHNVNKKRHKKIKNETTFFKLHGDGSEDKKKDRKREGERNLKVLFYFFLVWYYT